MEQIPDFYCSEIQDYLPQTFCRTPLSLISTCQQSDQLQLVLNKLHFQASLCSSIPRFLQVKSRGNGKVGQNDKKGTEHVLITYYLLDDC